MGPAEVVKRIGEQARIRYARVKYGDASRWPYRRFSVGPLELRPMPSAPTDADLRRFCVYGQSVNLAGEMDWHGSDRAGVRWPCRHYADLSYRPGNPWGDVRINWELNRLQFLPHAAEADPGLALRLLDSWVRCNPYQHGPGYLASMEVALRWLEIYWATCLLGNRVPAPLLRELSGLAAASGRFIEGKLSTHSSTGNHLILEAVGLYWVGTSLASSREGRRWLGMAREILWREVPRQVNADGSSVEQSFWYLGFVLDALLHYLLLEDPGVVPAEVTARLRKAVDFVDALTLGDGGFPDFGDRDDGVVFRESSEYDQSPFPGLIAVGRDFVGGAVSDKAALLGRARRRFWGFGREGMQATVDEVSTGPAALTAYPQGGMTLLVRGKLRALFRHSPLGLAPMYGHGHADALSVMLWWGNTPLLADVGSGQYNGSQAVRDYFRSTSAHNTVELGGRSQARMLGPFLWEASYRAELDGAEGGERPWALAWHDGYRATLSLVHHRRVEISSPRELRIVDRYTGTGRAGSRTAFHFPPGTKLELGDDGVHGTTSGVGFILRLPPRLAKEVYEGVTTPFLGWCSTVYGEWKKAPVLIVKGEAAHDEVHEFAMEVTSQ